MAIDLSSIIPLVYKDKSVFVIDKNKYQNNIQFFSLLSQNKDCYEIDINEFEKVEIERASLAPFINIFHPTRVRSTTLLKDLFYTEKIQCANEPSINVSQSADQLEDKVYYLLIKNLQSLSSIVCIKSSIQQTLLTHRLIHLYPQAYNLFIIRNPIDILVSNLSKPNHNFLTLSKKYEWTHSISLIKYIEACFAQAHKSRDIINFVSYDHLKNAQFYKTILSHFNLSVTDQAKLNIEENRKFNSHSNKIFTQSSKYEELYSRYKIEIEYLKHKTKTFKYYDEVSNLAAR